ncbi:UbiD family decarboxylase domain-containing protein [Thermodesulfobacteriota bacterium]
MGCNPNEIFSKWSQALSEPIPPEIVIEGLISTEFLELEGPFGESHGYLHLRRYNPYMDVTTITCRNDAYFTSIISQMTPHLEGYG